MKAEVPQSATPRCLAPCRASTCIMRSLSDIVAAYMNDPTEADSCRARLNRFLRWFERRKSVGAAIEAAILRNHPHQNCLPWVKRKLVAKRLLAASASLDAETKFEGIFAIVESCVRPPFNKPDLLVYDLSLRVGAYRKALPSLVYLHTGALKGARIVMNRTNVPRAIPLAMLPTAFSSLLPHEAEDCLCIYKQRFEALRKAGALR